MRRKAPRITQAGRPLPLRALLHCAFAGLLATALAGCATPESLSPGATRAQVIEQLGRPAAVHELPDGGTRLQYDSGPLNQQAWMVDLDAQGRVIDRRQVRTLENFFRLRVGVDDASMLRREFGTPWHVERYPLSGLTAWLYPYKEAGVWNSMMAVHVDDRGIVQRVENGPDRRFLGGHGRDD